MSGMFASLGAIGSALGVINKILDFFRSLGPVIKAWVDARFRQEAKDVLDAAVANPDREQAARDANDLFRGTTSKKPEPPKPAS